ncbi:hypothetical protein ruthe_02149, partial [Rubellimicrobium thermophilum DSM 16684]
MSDASEESPVPSLLDARKGRKEERMRLGGASRQPAGTGAALRGPVRHRRGGFCWLHRGPDPPHHGRSDGIPVHGADRARPSEPRPSERCVPA